MANIQIFTWKLMLPLIFVTVLNPLNSAMLSTALVPISDAFEGQEVIGGWLVASLYLTAAVAQPVLGSLADHIGARRILIGGHLVLAAGALLGAVAQDMLTLIASRVLIGFGTSSAFPCAVAIVRTRAQADGIEPPARILGYLAAASSVAVAVGPPLGGIVTEWIGWRGVFSINLPFAMAALLLIYFSVPSFKNSGHAKGTVDWQGIALFTAMMTAIVFVLMQLQDNVDWLAGAVALALGCVFYVVERKRSAPFINVDLISANRPLALTYGNHVAFNFANYCYFFAMPQWAQSALGQSLATSGLLLMPVAAASFLGSLLPTRRRAGFWTELTGASSTLVASIALLFAGEETPVIAVLVLSFGFGLGFGIVNMSNQQRLLDYAPVQQSGSAAGLLRTSAYLGAMLSAPLVGMMLTRGSDDFGISNLAWVMVPVALVPLATVFMDLRSGRHRER